MNPNAGNKRTGLIIGRYVLVTSGLIRMQGKNPLISPEDAQQFFALFVEVGLTAVLYKGWPDTT